MLLLQIASLDVNEEGLVVSCSSLQNQLLVWDTLSEEVKVIQVIFLGIFSFVISLSGNTDSYNVFKSILYKLRNIFSIYWTDLNTYPQFHQC